MTPMKFVILLILGVLSAMFAISGLSVGYASVTTCAPLDSGATLYKDWLLMLDQEKSTSTMASLSNPKIPCTPAHSTEVVRSGWVAAGTTAIVLFALVAFFCTIGLVLFSEKYTQWQPLCILAVGVALLFPTLLSIIFPASIDARGEVKWHAGGPLLCISFVLYIAAIIAASKIDGSWSPVVPVSLPRARNFAQMVLLGIAFSLLVAGGATGLSSVSTTHDSFTIPVKIGLLEAYPRKTTAKEGGTVALGTGVAYRFRASDANTVSSVENILTMHNFQYCAFLERHSKLAAAMMVFSAIAMAMTFITLVFEHCQLNEFTSFGTLTFGLPALLFTTVATGLSFAAQSHQCPQWPVEPSPLPGPACFLASAIVLLIAVLVRLFVSPTWSAPLKGQSSLKYFLACICMLTSFALAVSGLLAGRAEITVPGGTSPGESAVMRYDGVYPCPCNEGKLTDSKEFTCTAGSSSTALRETCGYHDTITSIIFEGNLVDPTQSGYCPSMNIASDAVLGFSIMGCLGVPLLAFSAFAYMCSAPVSLTQFTFVVSVCWSALHYILAACFALYLQYGNKCDSWTTSVASMPNVSSLPGPWLLVAAALVQLASVVLWITVSPGRSLPSIHNMDKIQKAVVVIILVAAFALAGAGQGVGYASFVDPSEGVEALRKTLTFFALNRNGRSLPSISDEYKNSLGGSCQQFRSANEAAGALAILGSIAIGLSVLLSVVAPTVVSVVLDAFAFVVLIGSSVIAFLLYDVIGCSQWERAFGGNGVNADRYEAEREVGPALLLASAITVMVCIGVVFIPPVKFKWISSISLPNTWNPKKVCPVFVGAAAIFLAMTSMVGFETAYMARNTCCVPATCANLRNFSKLSIDEQRPLGRSDERICVLSATQRRALDCLETPTGSSSIKGKLPVAVEFCKTSNQGSSTASSGGDICSKKPLVYNLSAAAVAFSCVIALILICFAMFLTAEPAGKHINPIALVFPFVPTLVFSLIVMGLAAGAAVRLDGDPAAHHWGYVTHDKAREEIGKSGSSSSGSKKYANADLTCWGDYGYGDVIFRSTTNNVLQRWHNPQSFEVILSVHAVLAAFIAVGSVGMLLYAKLM